MVYDKIVEAVRPSTTKAEVYLSPGWIDVQVNGFAGVDYNSGSASHEEIGRSIEVLFSTGVTRFSCASRPERLARERETDVGVPLPFPIA